MYQILSDKISHTVVVKVQTPEEFEAVRWHFESEGFVLIQNSYHYMMPCEKTLTFEKLLAK